MKVTDDTNNWDERRLSSKTGVTGGGRVVFKTGVGASF